VVFGVLPMPSYSGSFYHLKGFFLATESNLQSFWVTLGRSQNQLLTVLGSIVDPIGNQGLFELLRGLIMASYLPPFNQLYGS